MNKKRLKTFQKEYFDQLSGEYSTQNLAKIHNIHLMFFCFFRCLVIFFGHLVFDLFGPLDSVSCFRSRFRSPLYFQDAGTMSPKEGDTDEKETEGQTETKEEEEEEVEVEVEENKEKIEQV